MTISKEDINNILDQADNVESEFNEKVIKDLLYNIDKKYDENIFLRNKFKNNYNKYLPIEEELNEDIAYLNKIGAYPNLIEYFIQYDGLRVLTKILSHPNNDIINRTILILQEITDEDYLKEITNKDDILVGLIENNIIDIFIKTRK